MWLAQSRFRRRRFDECIDICTRHLERNPLDQAVWYLKCRALTLKNWVDDTEIEEQVGWAGPQSVGMGGLRRLGGWQGLGSCAGAAAPHVRVCMACALPVPPAVSERAGPMHTGTAALARAHGAFSAHACMRACLHAPRQSARTCTCTHAHTRTRRAWATCCWTSTRQRRWPGPARPWSGPPQGRRWVGTACMMAAAAPACHGRTCAPVLPCRHPCSAASCHHAPHCAPARTLRTQGGISQAVRPMTQSGRPVTGFARPGTSSRTGGGVRNSRGGDAATRAAAAANQPPGRPRAHTHLRPRPPARRHLWRAAGHRQPRGAAASGHRRTARHIPGAARDVVGAVRGHGGCSARGPGFNCSGACRTDPGLGVAQGAGARAREAGAAALAVPPGGPRAMPLVHAPHSCCHAPLPRGRRFVRLGTASMLSEPGGPFINSDKVDLR